jgi:hypothetical protein
VLELGEDGAKVAVLISAAASPRAIFFMRPSSSRKRPHDERLGQAASSGRDDYLGKSKLRSWKTLLILNACSS